jgi:predicted ester cyclase
MTRAEVLAFLDRHQQSFASRQPATLAADHVVDGTFESQAVGAIRGREAIEGVYRYWLTAFPDMTFTWREPVIEGDRSALFWHFHGTMAGPFFGHSNPGTRLDFLGAAEYHLSPAGIVSARHVFDFTGALVAAGVFRIKPV